MAITSLTRVYCDKCNPQGLNGGSGPTWRGVLTVPFAISGFGGVGNTLRDMLAEHGWRWRGNEHWCPICVKGEHDVVDDKNVDRGVRANGDHGRL